MNAVTPIPRGSLSFLERRVVEMGRQDGPRSLNPEGLFAGLVRLFGFRVTHGLANERLEALRRFSVRAWHWDLIRTKDTRAFFDAGYSRHQLLEILSRVGMARGFTPTIEDEAAPALSRNRSSDCRCG